MRPRKSSFVAHAARAEPRGAAGALYADYTARRNELTRNLRAVGEALKLPQRPGALRRALKILLGK